MTNQPLLALCETAGHGLPTAPTCSARCNKRWGTWASWTSCASCFIPQISNRPIWHPCDETIGVSGGWVSDKAGRTYYETNETCPFCDNKAMRRGLVRDHPRQWLGYRHVHYVPARGVRARRQPHPGGRDRRDDSVGAIPPARSRQL